MIKIKFLLKRRAQKQNVYEKGITALFLHASTYTCCWSIETGIIKQSIFCYRLGSCHRHKSYGGKGL